MYGLTDAFYVSRGVGGYASAAVGVFSPVTFLIGGITTTVGTGTGSVLSRKLGANEKDKAGDAVGCMFFLWIVCAGLVTLFGLSLFEPLARLLGASRQIALAMGFLLETIVISNVFLYTDSIRSSF